jgi:hypothetical protein
VLSVASVLVAPPALAVASIVSCTPTVNTGCGLTSTNAPAPAANTARVARSNNTGSRKFRYQYSPSNPAISNTPPVTAE